MNESTKPSTTLRRDLLRSILLATGILLAWLLATDVPSALHAAALLRAVDAPQARIDMPAAPFVWQAGKVLLFYPLLGALIGATLFAVARVLASRRTAGGQWSTSRRRTWAYFIPLLLLVTTYIHLHAMLLYPGMFDASWRWAALAGSRAFVAAFSLVGPIGAGLLLLAVVYKRRETILHRKRRLLVAAASLAVLAAAIRFGALWMRPSQRNRGPNIILIGLDSLRPDHVSALGYGRDTTPNLDRFLKDAVLFENVFVPLARTGPSWMSILTGAYPTTHGHRCDLAPKESRLPPVATLAGHLRALGYESSFFLDNATFMFMDPEFGFAHIDQPEPTALWFMMSFAPFRLMAYKYVLNNRLGFLYEPMLRANQAFSKVYQPRHFARAIARRLERMKREEKFFLAAHTCLVHAPFTLRFPCSTLFSPPGPTPKNRFAFREPYERIFAGKGAFPWTDSTTMLARFAQERNLYDTLVRETDDWLGMVLASLRAQGLYDDALIAVFSDHGEDLYRPDLAYRYPFSNHGFHVWGDGGYRNVLAVKFPRARYAGRRIPWLVRSIDIAPTVLAALNLPALPQADGRSLLPQVDDPALDPGLATYAEAGMSLDLWFVPGHRPYPFAHWAAFQYVDPASQRIYRRQEFMPGFVMAKDRSLRTDRWKIIAFPMQGDPIPFKTTLHDVARDPTNRVDLSTSEPAALADMRARLAPFIESDARQYDFQWRWLDPL